jgi:restriction endonuclease Mrr
MFGCRLYDSRVSIIFEIVQGMTIHGTRPIPPKGTESRDGAPPIELIDGEKLVGMFKELELGLKPVKTYEIDEAFFEEFRK